MISGKSPGGGPMVLMGLGIIAVLFLVYSRYQNPELLTPDAIDGIIRIAYAFYILFFLALGAMAYGLYLYHAQKAAANGRGLVTTIALATWNRKGRRIWIVTFAGYGIFFSLASGTLVYQPDVMFSDAYGAQIPSGFMAPCCDEPGYMPTIIIYLTEHTGLQIIPINILLQIVVSYLVALNVSLAAVTIPLSRSSRSMGSVGAATGLFIACPTCAGTFLSLFLGTASGLGAAFVITQLQTIFIAVTIPVLLATPFIIAKKLQNADGSCMVGRH